MSNLKTGLSTNKKISSKEVKLITEKSFFEKMKSETEKSVLATYKSFLIIINVTLIFALVLLADNLIIWIISWSFDGIVNQLIFAAMLLKGIKLLSALGTATAYGLRLIRDTKHNIKDAFHEENSQKEEQQI